MLEFVPLLVQLGCALWLRSVGMLESVPLLAQLEQLIFLEGSGSSTLYRYFHQQ
jgi:hypothetical protein